MTCHLHTSKKYWNNVLKCLETRMKYLFFDTGKSSWVDFCYYTNYINLGKYLISKSLILFQNPFRSPSYLSVVHVSCQNPTDNFVISKIILLICMECHSKNLRKVSNLRNFYYLSMPYSRVKKNKKYIEMTWEFWTFDPPFYMV